MAATRSLARPGQRSFDDLGTPLAEVTFCVLDLETTGASPAACAITEVGAVKVRGGEVLGTFHTLVNPGTAIPPAITVLTGITHAMVLPAPRIAAVLPALEEFVHGTVLVGHNVRFDVSFLNAALDAHQRPRLDVPTVDTAALARRLVRDEVRDCRLGTLARTFRLSHQPSHRALDDALATTDLLHLLLERAGAWGVVGLDDLLALPGLHAHPQAAKLRMTTALPRRPGVYLFVGEHDEVLYVGKAANLRQRVRSYFSTDERRKVAPLLREVRAIRHRPCATTLEAAVLELRLIHHLQPRYNAVGTRRKPAWLRLTLSEPFPRLVVARAPRGGSDLELGPLSSAAVARQVADAIEAVAPLRRCTLTVRPGVPVRSAPCAPAQLGVAHCPCAGGCTPADYARTVATVVQGLTTHPQVLLAPLQHRLAGLAGAERFEEAADLRDRAAALAGALRRHRRIAALRAAGVIRLGLPGGGAELRHGILVRSWADATEPSAGPPPHDEAQGALAFPEPAVPAPPEGHPATPLPLHLADEVACIAAALDADAHRVRVLHCSGELASPVPPLPTFRPATRPTTRPATPPITRPGGPSGATQPAAAASTRTSARATAAPGAPR